MSSCELFVFFHLIIGFFFSTTNDFKVAMYEITNLNINLIFLFSVFQPPTTLKITDALYMDLFCGGDFTHYLFTKVQMQEH